MAKGWLIGEYTGDPYKDLKITAANNGSLTTANSACTVTVEGSVVSAMAIGTASGADIYFTSTSAQKTAGSVIFTSGATAGVLFNYQIIHKGQ
jgi:hypothetical protein